MKVLQVQRAALEERLEELEMNEQAQEVRCGVVWCGVVWCGVVWCAREHSCISLSASKPAWTNAAPIAPTF